MSRVFFLYKNDRRILIMDLSSIKDVNSSIEIIDSCEETITRLPLKSALLLTDVTGTSYDMLGIERIRTFSRNISPFIKASAVSGATDEKEMIIEMLEKMTGRRIAAFATRQEAVDFLVSVAE